MFFYFRAEPESGQPQHFWRYYDLEADQIVDNRWVIANLIACERDTPRVVADYNAFAVQEEVIEDILESQRTQAALERAPAKPDPLQTTVATTLRDQMNRPGLARDDVVTALKYLAVPMTGVQVRELREAHGQYQQDGNVQTLLEAVLQLRATYGENGRARPAGGAEPITRDDLRLICFDYICS